MHLKSLTLRGFKSFASATTLKFEPGICAVVGPNGSGKSNVVDALAWVMGEQGAKTLRGGKMEDVIFAGTSGRKPLGRAEVTLTIDNADGALPIQFSEVSVTRRMFRDGASEYEINGAKARLMDVQELLSDSGIGREMHIIVGQGRLASILESRPEDRRSYIEEAAGVLKHRRRKEKALRKLNSMQANLDRLEDLTGELSRQLKPLARQAEAAKRAHTVQADLRDAKLRLAAADLVDLKASLNDVSLNTAALTTKISNAELLAEETAETSASLEEELAAISEAASAARDVWFRLSALAERVAATRRIAADRSTLTAEVPWTGQDPEHLETRAVAAEEEEARLEMEEEAARDRLESVRDTLADTEEAARTAESEYRAEVRAIADRREGVVRLIAAEESLRHRLDAAQAEVERLNEQFGESDDRRSEAAFAAEEAAEELAEAELEGPELTAANERARTESEAATARVKELRQTEKDAERKVSGLAARIEALETTARESLTDGAGWLKNKHDLAALSDSITIADGWDTAVSAALGPAAEALTSAKPDSLIAELTDAEAGRALILATSTADSWRMDADLPADVRWALDVVDVPAELRAAVASLLVDVVLCGSSDQARAVVTSDNRLRAVTPDGTVCGAEWVEGGRGGRRKAMELGGDIAAATAELEQAQKDLDELSGTLTGAIEEEEDRRTDAASARAALKEHQNHLSTAKSNSNRATAYLASLDKESGKASARREEAEKRVTDLTEELDELADRLSRVDQDPAEHEPSTDERDRTAAALAQARAMETEARLALRTAEERSGSTRGSADRLRRHAAAERQARARHEEVQERRRRERAKAEEVARLADDLHTHVTTELTQATADRDAREAALKSVNAALQKARNDASNAARELSHLTNEGHREELARAEAALRVDQAEKTAADQLGIAAEDLLAEFSPDEDFDRATTQKRLKQAEKDLRALGRVNPLALEEYKAMEERYTFLSTQLDDVKQARKDLFEVVAEVDETILALFADAWKDVEAEFPRVFDTLFPGGEGRLVLTDPDDLLTTGIEVEARPPGKKVKRLSLLSGGEKSLTALALLVAIFRARPSPFYVLDEVEAALDDVNLRRLINLLKELQMTSQLIVITHQKPTMDIANVLYGVTMQGDGVTRVLSQRMRPVTAEATPEPSQG
ncbi:chromosome segregation protein SMC [Corynebacterium sputi]|uniref:chromosome segregation protein SMC n=1 Tax=Corynebacterium sputi TaxID=489915 RepID=UPI00047C8829|nr:chromosome segregation protein SMC [Corynebacterium sputi]